MAHRTPEGITFFPYPTLSAFFEAEGGFPENGVEDPRDLVHFSETDEGVKWFLNEDGTPYPYPEHLQAEAFPNDFHTPYSTEQEAQRASDQDWDLTDAPGMYDEPDYGIDLGPGFSEDFVL